MKVSFHPARLSLPRMEPFDGSLLARLRAMRLRMARFSGPFPVRFRARSSFMATSSTQCREFSMAQCERAMPSNRSGVSARLEM